MEYFRNLEETLKDVAPSNILNFDETNLTDDPGYSKFDQIEIYSSKNIKSGFRETGIYPFNPREVLKRVPEYQEDVASYGIDNALLDYLKQIRQPNPMITKRNKKVMTVPGKSVIVDDLLLTVTDFSD
ncbi:unnamed protein product [Parnassius apollo]|uniref:(apollo) hypothetical protein n=1 Tax=Parnassius apollo TaxID=110799 RepID=A0A8S3WIP6_PARAO|nr:unnamed protein product [Parnassius apollo]